MDFRPLLLSLLIAAPMTAQAAVYKCTVDGKTVFSDRPCAADAKEIKVTAPPPVGGTLSTDGIRSNLAGFERDRKLKDVDREIERRRDNIANIRSRMAKDVERWQREKARANNNLAGAVWEQGLAQEAEVIQRGYQAQIDSEQKEIDRLLAQRDKL